MLKYSLVAQLYHNYLCEHAGFCEGIGYDFSLGDWRQNLLCCCGMNKCLRSFSVTLLKCALLNSILRLSNSQRIVVSIIVCFAYMVPEHCPPTTLCNALLFV